MTEQGRYLCVSTCYRRFLKYYYVFFFFEAGKKYVPSTHICINNACHNFVMNCICQPRKKELLKNLLLWHKALFTVLGSTLS